MKTMIFALAGAALVLTTPAFAGSSSRAEREATRQLNIAAAQQAQATQPQVAVADAGAALPMNSPPAAAPTTPIQSAAMANADGPAATLSTIQRPPGKIASANVRDASGQIVGAVQRVEVTPDGTPTQVAVALIGKDERMVVLDASAVTYDPSRNEILAPQSTDQLRAQSRAG